MLIRFEDLTNELRGGAVTIGNFDGVHRGHAQLVRRLVEAAGRCGGPSLVLTFDPHPLAVLRPELAPVPLTTASRRAELLATLGVDGVVVCRSSPELLSLTAEEFFRRVLVEKLGARAIVEGPNFFFGRGRAGDVRLLGELCVGGGVELTIVEPELTDGEWISSSRVRELVQQGEVGAARKLLTAPHRARGVVVRGAARGAGLGFPTANVGHVETLVPGPGVYAGRACVSGRSWPAAIHVGPIPTFGIATHVIEAHLLDFSEDIYGRSIDVDFLERIRTVRKFNGLDELKRQLTADVAEARRLASQLGNQP